MPMQDEDFLVLDKYVNPSAAADPRDPLARTQVPILVPDNHP
jgi:hypothetical protein